MASFKPDLMINHYKEFDIDTYHNLGYDTLLLDIDNTLSPYYEKHPDEDVLNFINELKEKGFKVIIISNNTSERVETYCRDIDCKYYYFSLKPFSYTYQRLIKENHLDKNKIICLGDQLLTDILGGNSLGLYTIYCKPIVDNDNFSGKITRLIEKFIFKIYEKM